MFHYNPVNPKPSFWRRQIRRVDAVPFDTLKVSLFLTFIAFFNLSILQFIADQFYCFLFSLSTLFLLRFWTSSIHKEIIKLYTMYSQGDGPDSEWNQMFKEETCISQKCAPPVLNSGIFLRLKENKDLIIFFYKRFAFLFFKYNFLLQTLFAGNNIFFAVVISMNNFS